MHWIVAVLIGVLFYFLVKIFILKNNLTKKKQTNLILLSVLFVFGVEQYRFYFGSEEVGSLFQKGINYSVEYYAKTEDQLVVAELFIDNDSNDFTTVYIEKLIFPDGKEVSFKDMDNLDVDFGFKSYPEDSTGKEWEVTLTEDMVKK